MVWAFAAGGVLVVIFAISIYNKLVLLKNRFQNAFAQIDVQLKRRYELIPNLIETAKAFMSHERETLEAVIKARNMAQSANQNLHGDSANAAGLQQLLGSEGQLSSALGKLFALSESYPDLKSNQNMMQLTEELTSTENKVSFARQSYNDAVTRYNTAREVFPNSIIAGFFNFQPTVLFEITDSVEREAIKVKF